MIRLYKNHVESHSIKHCPAVNIYILSEHDVKILPSDKRLPKAAPATVTLPQLKASPKITEPIISDETIFIGTIKNEFSGKTIIGSAELKAGNTEWQKPVKGLTIHIDQQDWFVYLSDNKIFLTRKGDDCNSKQQMRAGLKINILIDKDGNPRLRPQLA